MQSGTVSNQKRSGTVLFADVVGFTSFAEQLGEETAFEMIQAVTARMQEAITVHSGTIGEFRGDGIMALFSVTEGLEDGPLRACKSALQIQQMIDKAAPEMTRSYGLAPQVRIGVHCGPLVVGDVGKKGSAHVTIIGDTANVASRLEGMAQGGQVLISGDLFALVEGQVVVDDLGKRAMKGKSLPQQIYALRDVHNHISRFEVAISRGLSTFVDREEELETLKTLFASAKHGVVTAANVRGEPGIGKSRLLYEFEAMIPKDHLRILKGDCRADGETTPFLPFADLMRNLFDIDHQDSAAQTEAKIAAQLRNKTTAKDRTVPYLMTLLGKSNTSNAHQGESADMVGARTRQAVVDVIADLCQENTVLLILEDLHWADPGSIQIIEMLLEHSDEMSLMILCTSRPVFQHVWFNTQRVTEIQPKPISKVAVASLIREVMAGSGQAEAMAKIAIEKADGNPLYAEEIAKFLLQRHSDGSTLDATALPTNLQNLVMERFDKLSAPCRQMLQAASAIGRKFDAQVAAQIAKTDPPLEPETLDEAIAADLVTHADSGFQFKHALVQDAIYDTLLRGQRKALHSRIAAALEHRFSNRLDEAAESLAFHYDQADMPSEAARHLISAGLRNLSLFSLKGAETSFARAHALLSQGAVDLPPEQIANLFAGWFEVQQWHAEFGRTLQLFEAESARLALSKDDPGYPRILGLAGVAYCQDMQFDRAAHYFDQAIEIGEETGDRNAITDGCLGRMVLNCSLPKAGSWQQTQELATRINDLWGDETQPYYRTYCSFYQNWSRSIRGDIDLALEYGHALYAQGEEMKFSGAIGWGAICIAFNEAYSENFEAAIRYAASGAEAAGGKVDQMVCLGLKGLSMVLAGDVQEGSRILNEIYDQGVALDFRGVENIVDGPIGLAKAIGGDLGGGVEWIKNAIRRASDNGNMHAAAMSHISLGTLYLLLATGTEKPDLKSVLRNIGFLIREAPFAKSRAISHFDAAIEIGLNAEMHGVAAQALHSKAQALTASRKTEKARAALLDAQRYVKKIRWEMMANRIESDLAKAG